MSNQQMIGQQSQANQQLAPVKRLLLPQIKALCRDEKEAISIYATAVRLATNPKIMECSPDSIVNAFTQAIDLGMHLDPVFGECDFLPYNKRLGFQLRAKGYALLAEREGGWEIQTIPVFNCDIYESEPVYEGGWLSEKVTFKPNVEEREAHAQDESWVFENLRLVIANARRTVTGGKTEIATVSMTKAMIEHRRLNFSQAQKVAYTPDDKKRISSGLPIGIWREHYTAMAIKTVLGTIGKKLPKTAKMENALKFLNAESEVDVVSNSIDASFTVNPDVDVAELTVIPENKFDWTNSIMECGDKKTLSSLLVEMNDEERAEYGETIDFKLDSFDALDQYTDLKTVISECATVDDLEQLIKDMPDKAREALKSVLDARMAELSKAK